MKRTTRSWISVLVATMALQAVASFLIRLPPTIAPYLTATTGIADSAIGYLSMVSTFGSIVFLFVGAPLIRRFGSIRSLQVGTAAGLAGLFLIAWPQPAAIGLAVFLLGLGYGPSPGAGSDILQRYAPPHRRSLVFSIKQAGVPIGGVLAGLVLPPVIAAFGIWGAIGTTALIGIVVIACVQPLRAEVDADRQPTSAIGVAALLSLSNISAPIRAVTGTPALLRLALAGMCYSLCQGTWFAFLVTYLVTKLGYSLALAGAVFAVTQATGIVGRIMLGWAADKRGSGREVLAAAGVASAVCSIALAASSPAWPVWLMFLVAAVSGIAVSSWNGVQIAEMVRIAPGEIHTTVAGATAIVFLGYMLGPAVFALLLTTTERYDIGLMCVAAAGVVGAVLAYGRR